jgi:hypothetical protein
VGCYNALQYLALKTSTPLNVTLVASSMPLWMLAVGALFFGARSRASSCWAPRCRWPAWAWCCRAGEWAHLLELRLVTGDLSCPAGHRLLGAVQLAADAPRRARQRSEATGRRS